VPTPLCPPSRILHSFHSVPQHCRPPGARSLFLPLLTPSCVSAPRCGALLVESPGERIRGGGSAGSAAFETITKPVDLAGSAPGPMPFKKTGAVMADVWSTPDAEVEPTPPPSPAFTPPASLHGDAANDVKPVPTPSQRIRKAAV